MLIAKRLSDGSESYVNRTTGTRYVLTRAHNSGDDQWSVYAEGQFLRRTDRAGALALIEGLMS